MKDSDMADIALGNGGCLNDYSTAIMAPREHEHPLADASGLSLTWGEIILAVVTLGGYAWYRVSQGDGRAKEAVNFTLEVLKNSEEKIKNSQKINLNLCLNGEPCQVELTEHNGQINFSKDGSNPSLFCKGTLLDLRKNLAAFLEKNQSLCERFEAPSLIKVALDIEGLSKLSGEVKFRITDPSQLDVVCDKLQANGAVKSVTLNMSQCSFPPAADGKSRISSLSKLSGKLVELNVHASRLTSADAATIAQLPNLKELDISNNDLGDEGVIKLVSGQGLANLDSLKISHNKFGDEGAKAIATKLTELTFLDMSSNTVSDVGMNEIIITNLPNLRELLIIDNELKMALPDQVESCWWKSNAHIGRLSYLNINENTVDKHKLEAMRERYLAATIDHFEDKTRDRQKAVLG
jgi:hypothetical protein